MGAVLHTFSNGKDPSPVKRSDYTATVKSVGNSATTPRDLVCEEDVHLMLYLLAESVATRMRDLAARCMVVELMGNKAGWLTLYAGIAGGADIILLPERPYSIESVCSAIERRAEQGKSFSILAVAEGVFDVAEARMKRKERMAKRAELGYSTATNRIAKDIEEMTGFETRVCVPGHMQRGGSPSPYDRLLATQFGAYAAKMVENEIYGITVAMKNNHVEANKLSDIAGKARLVPESHGMLDVARRMGISLG